MSKAKLSGTLRLIRPANSAMMGFAVLVGALLAARGGVERNVWSGLSLGFVTGFALTAASMAFNDYFDREIDAVNQPRRPIPSGLITPREAITMGLLWTLTGFATAAATGILTLVTAAVAWTMFTSYALKGKRMGLPGNLLVSSCVVTPFFYGSILLRGSVGVNTLLSSAIAFLCNTGREVTKGIPDAVGDVKGGVRTIAVTHGEKRAAIVSVTLFSVAVALSPLPPLVGSVSVFYMPAVALADLGLVFSSVSLLREPTADNASRTKTRLLIWMLLGLAAFLMGALT